MTEVSHDRSDAEKVLVRVIQGDVTAVRDLESFDWSDVVVAMQFTRSPIDREAAKRALLSSRDPETSTRSGRYPTKLHS